jgi:hypothetical protein
MGLCGTPVAGGPPAGSSSVPASAAGLRSGRSLVSARAEGISIRTLATAIGLSSSRVHQIVAAADPDALDAALGEHRAAGWPAPEHPDPGKTPNSAAAL